jgi:hypothetical protein
VYTKTQVDTSLALKANSADVYSKTQIDSTLGSYALTSSIGSYFNTAVRSTTDSNNYITFSGSGNTVTLGYDNLLSALGSFALSSSLGSYALRASPTFSGTVDFTGATVNGLSKTTVGLANVDNTSDLNKPVSTAVTTALATKQNTLSGTNLLDASFINTNGVASVSNAQFGYLNTLTSNVQTQLKAKQQNISGSNRVAASFIGTGVVDNATFAHVAGVTSSIQTQFNTINTTISNLTTVYACAFITNNGTTATASGPRGVTITPSRVGVGLVTLTLATAHPQGTLYTINATAYVVGSGNTNPIICTVIRLPTTSTQFRISTSDHTNTAVDTNFMVSVI